MEIMAKQGNLQIYSQAAQGRRVFVVTEADEVAIKTGLRRMGFKVVRGSRRLGYTRKGGLTAEFAIE